MVADEPVSDMLARLVICEGADPRSATFDTKGIH